MESTLSPSDLGDGRFSPGDNLVTLSPSLHPISRDLSPAEIIYVVIGVLGISLNLLVLVVFSRFPNLISGSSRAARRIIINQSLLDGAAAAFLVGSQFFSSEMGDSTFVFLSFAEDLEEDLSLNHTTIPHWVPEVGYNVYCRLLWSTFIVWSLMSGSNFNKVALTIERFLAVIHPVWHHNNCTNGKHSMKIVGVVCSVVWILGFLNNAMSLFSTHHAADSDPPQCVWSGLGLGPLIHDVVGMVEFVLDFPLPVIIHVFCYTKVIIRIMTSVAAENHESKTRRLVHACLLVGASFIVCYLPFQIASLQRQFGGDQESEEHWWPLCVALCFINCLCNPIIYIWKIDDFRRCVQALFLCRSAALDLGESGSNEGPGAATANQQHTDKQQNDQTVNVVEVLN